jgi:hypothetical protein
MPQKSKFAVLVLGFEKLRLELDNYGRTTKNAYCRIYSLCILGLWIQRQSTYLVHLSYDFFRKVKQGLILEEAAEKSTQLNELNVIKQTVVSISQRREDPRFYNGARNLTISNPGFTSVS